MLNQFTLFFDCRNFNVFRKASPTFLFYVSHSLFFVLWKQDVIRGTQNHQVHFLHQAHKATMKEVKKSGNWKNCKMKERR